MGAKDTLRYPSFNLYLEYCLENSLGWGLPQPFGKNSGLLVSVSQSSSITTMSPTDDWYEPQDFSSSRGTHNLHSYGPTTYLVGPFAAFILGPPFALRSGVDLWALLLVSEKTPLLVSEGTLPWPLVWWGPLARTSPFERSPLRGLSWTSLVGSLDAPEKKFNCAETALFGDSGPFFWFIFRGLTVSFFWMFSSSAFCHNGKKKKTAIMECKGTINLFCDHLKGKFVFALWKIFIFFKLIFIYTEW